VIKTLCLACLLLLCASATRAQSSNYDRCIVTIADLQTKKSTELGSFSTVIAEEELTTKAFRLPRTSLFIVASVFYTDESMASTKGQNSVSLELSLSRGKQRNVLRSLSWAEAEMPLNVLDVGRVTMLIRVNGHPQFVQMECRNVRVLIGSSIGPPNIRELHGRKISSSHSRDNHRQP
jgi:hypothetical protein